MEELVTLKRTEEGLQKAHAKLEVKVEQGAAELLAANETLQEEIAERKRVEGELRRSERELRIRNRIADIFLVIPDEEMYGEVLQVILEAAESRYGVFGYIDQNETLVCPSMTKDIWDQCAVSEKTIIYPREAWGGLWGQSLIEKKTFFSNELSRVPEGHIPIFRNLALPIIHQGNVIGLLNVANKATDYDQQDQELLETIADAIAPVLAARLQRDIQEKERKQAEEELQKAHNRLETKVKERTAKLEHTNAELEQFAYVASHDLQEPLRNVRSYTELLAERYQGRLDAKADKFIGYIVDGASRMQRLVSDLLSYSRVGEADLSPELTNVADAMGQVLGDMEALIQENDALVTCDPLPTIIANNLQISQLLLNLIGNAIKFRSENPPRIHVSAEQKDKEWVFSVSDNGIGIEPQYAERIFTVFQRLHTRETYPGTGIGLAICRKIVERHGGRIWMESEIGKGTTFFFTIPAKQEG